MYYARKVDGYFKRKSFFLKFVVFEKNNFLTISFASEV